MDASQPLIQGTVYVNNNTTLSMYDASTYEGVQWFENYKYFFGK